MQARVKVRGEEVKSDRRERAGWGGANQRERDRERTREKQRETDRKKERRGGGKKISEE